MKAFIICYNFLKGITAAIYHKNFEGNITQTKGTYMEKNLTDNYEKQIYIGRDLFLRYDQDMLIKKYKLKNDHAYLYLNYIGTEYRISRSDGSIEYMAKSIWKICKEYSIVMTIYDLLCYSEDKPLPPLTGQWQPVTRFIPTGSSPSGDVFTRTGFY